MTSATAARSASKGELSGRALQIVALGGLFRSSTRGTFPHRAVKKHSVAQGPSKGPGPQPTQLVGLAKLVSLVRGEA